MNFSVAPLPQQLPHAGEGGRALAHGRVAAAHGGFVRTGHGHHIAGPAQIKPGHRNGQQHAAAHCLGQTAAKARQRPGEQGIRADKAHRDQGIGKTHVLDQGQEAHLHQQHRQAADFIL